MPLVDKILEDNEHELIYDPTLPKKKYVIRHKEPFYFVKDFKNKKDAINHFNKLQTKKLHKYPRERFESGELNWLEY